MGVGGMFSLISAIVGAFIGAGFASGKELASFFVVFGRWGLVGIVLMAILFAVGGWFVLWLCTKLDVDSYEALLKAVLPPFWAKGFTVLISVALWLGLGLMLVGCATLGTLLWDWPRWVGFALALVGTYAPLRLGKSGFLRVGSYLVPIMLAFAVVMAMTFLRQASSCAVMATLLPNWYTSATLYWLYNNLLVMAVLISLRKQRGIYGAVGISAVFIGGLALLLSQCLLRLPVSLLQSPMPLLSVAHRLNGFWGTGYGLVMLLAMYTTALANCYSLLNNYSPYVARRQTLLCLILLPTILFGAFDFGKLVNTIYPLLGYISGPIMVALLVKAVKLLSGGRL